MPMHQITTSSFNSRPHKEVDVLATRSVPFGVNFQLTTSQGGRPGQIYQEGWSLSLSTHDLTRRSTSATSSQVYIFDLSTHDLTRRSTRLHHRVELELISFNSRPHKEVDLAELADLPVFFLSTHDLTRRSTVAYLKKKYSISLSTHDLTRRSTYHPVTLLQFLGSFNSRPHKEVDMVDALERGSTSVFQLTTSQGGRL